MKKFPVELLTTKTANAKSGCPIIWDGIDIILSTDEDLNLQKIAQSIAALKSTTNTLTSDVSEISSTVGNLVPQVNALNLLIPNMSLRLQSIEIVLNSESGVTVRLSMLEERVNNLEQDVNNIITGGQGGSGGGLSSTYTAILSSLNSGTYIVGENGIKVEKVDTGGSAGQYKISLEEKPVKTKIESSSDLITVVEQANSSFKLGFANKKLSNYVTAAYCLEVDPREEDRVVIKPTANLVVGDNATIKVEYSAITGQFKVSAIAGSSGSGSGSSVVIDNKVIIKQNNALTVSPDYLRATAGEMFYLSNNFNEMKTVANSSRFSAYSDTDFYQRLATKGIANKAAAIAHPDFPSSLKTFIFNSANAAALDGKFYLLKDFNNQSSIEHITSGVVIEEPAKLKSFRLDFEAFLRCENLSIPAQKFGTNFPLSIANLMMPFIIYSVEHIGNGKVCFLSGDVLRYGSTSADGTGGEFLYSDHRLTDNNGFSARNLDSGLFRSSAFIGVKVATSADNLFASSFLGKFSMEPKLRSIIQFS